MAWLTGYSKRKKITLTGGSSGAQTDFQLSLAVAYAAAMQGDFDDIRFTQADGTTLIDAWAEVIVTDTSATVWVEFPTTPANTVEQDYYMYYGNSGAASDWDIRDTMLDGDDFPGSSLDAAIWDDQLCTKAVSGGVLTLSTFTGGGRFDGGIRGKRLIPATCVVEMKLKNVYASDGSRMGISNQWDSQTDDSEMIHFSYNNNMVTFVRNEGVYGYSSGGSWSANQYYNLKIVATGSGVTGYYDGNIIGSTVTTDIPDEQMYLRLIGDNNYSPTINCDWIFARKYAANPPTYAFGSEESVSGHPTMRRWGGIPGMQYSGRRSW
jgi:hypothetical protein